MTVKRTGTDSRFFKVFETIGRPFYLVIYGSVYFAVFFASALSRLSARLAKKLSRIKSRPPKARIPLGPTLLVFALILFLLLISRLFLPIFSGLPDPNQLLTRQQIVTTKIYDRNGELLYKIYRQQNRTLAQLKDIPLALVQATIAVEDAEFYQHHGFSFRGIFRAILRNLQGDKLYGGSTITQQLVKNALLSPQRTWDRKIKEIILAVLVETKFSKDQILQMYLNEVGYGGTTYGVGEAAQIYFGESAEKLNLAESALLAGLPASPTRFSPFGTHPELAKERQKLVLKRMMEEGFITEEESRLAENKELNFAPQRTDIKAPHFVMYIKELLVQKFGEREVEEGGLEVKTSLDFNIQEQAQKILTQEVNRLKSLRIGNGAALVTNSQTGEILAMVGSKDYFDATHDGNVNVTLRPRQPGSAIKPVNYSIALERGFTLATILSDTPITYQIPGQPPYSPRNYDGRFHGNISLRTALASSYNVPAVKVLSAFGVEEMVKRGQAMGITTWEDPSRFGLSLTLGGGEVKMIDLAVVYGTLANLGARVDLNPILEVRDYKGKILEGINREQLMVNSKKVISPGVAYLLTNILSDNNARTPAFGPSSWLNVANHPHVAVKTGTTQNLRDNWAIGYTPDFLVAVWVGNNDNSPMSYVASGVTGASPIWNKTMSYLLENTPDKEFPRPEDIIKAKVCSREEYFIAGTESKVICPSPPTPTPP